MLFRDCLKVTTGQLVAAGLAVGGVGCGPETPESGGMDSGISLSPNAPSTSRQANRPPSADFQVSDDLPEDGDPVRFDASASNDPDGDDLTYAWRFGDQIPGGGQQISHIYSEGGDFEVTLTVADAAGQTDSVTKTVSIKDTPLQKGEAEVTVIVRDMNYHDVGGVQISPVGADVTKTTDADGGVTFEQMPAGEPLVFEATKKGYAKQVARITLPEQAQSAPLQIRMQPIGEVVTVSNIQEGAEVEAFDGARLNFPEDAVVDAQGNPVTGEISVEFTTFDVSKKPSVDGFPGSFLGLTPDGEIDPIVSFGAMEVNLKQDGQRLQVKPGKTVEMDVPAYKPGLPHGAQVPLWSLDESTGIWVKEGHLKAVENSESPTDRVMRTEVTHFTTWNGDYPRTTPCRMKPKCKIMDPDHPTD